MDKIFVKEPKRFVGHFWLFSCLDVFLTSKLYKKKVNSEILIAWVSNK